MKQSPATHTPATIEAVVRDISDALVSVRAHAENMKTWGLDSVRIKAGQAEVERALVGLGNFGIYLEKAIREARIERGDFGAGHEKNGDRPKPARKK